MLLNGIIVSGTSNKLNCSASTSVDATTKNGVSLCDKKHFKITNFYCTVCLKTKFTSLWLYLTKKQAKKQNAAFMEGG